jgi:hypothetical protein
VGPADHSAGLGGGVESSESIQLCWVGVKGYRVRGPPAGSVRRAYAD